MSNSKFYSAAAALDLWDDKAGFSRPKNTLCKPEQTQTDEPIKSAASACIPEMTSLTHRFGLYGLNRSSNPAPTANGMYTAKRRSLFADNQPFGPRYCVRNARQTPPIGKTQSLPPP